MALAGISIFLVEVTVLPVICMLLHVSGSRIEFLCTIKFAKLSMFFNICLCTFAEILTFKRNFIQ